MQQRCRITVVGDSSQVDLAVPANAPLATYADSLAALCGQTDSDIMPSAWTLAPVGGRPFLPERSLAEVGVVDGAMLYLCDVIADEYAEPVVQDIGERVAESAGNAIGKPWDPDSRTVSAVALGAAWLIAALVVACLRHQIASTALAEVSALAGLVLPVLAWMAKERRWTVPTGVRNALAWAGVPVLALAGRETAVTHWSDAVHRANPPMSPIGLTACGLAIGALVGACLALTAAPGVTSGVVLLAALVATALSLFPALLHADAAQAAGVVAVVAFGLLVLISPTVGWLVAHAYRYTDARMPAREDDADAVAEATRAADILLVVWNATLSAVLAVALAVMAYSTSPYAAGAAAALGLGLLVRAGAAKSLAEVAPVGVAGVTPLFTLLLVGTGRIGWTGGAGVAASVAVGAVLLSYGFRRLMRRNAPPPATRPRWLVGLASAFGGGGVGLIVITFGLLGQLVDLGHKV
jgi:WXG100 protein secretion system (Wss), protein YukD